MSAASLLRTPHRRAPLSASIVFRELALVLGLYLAYQAVRWYAIGDIRDAFTHARMVIDWERATGIYLERPMQDWITENGALTRSLSTFYLFGLYPLMLFLGVVTFVWRRDLYQWARNAVFISWSIALATYVLFPVAPPRFLSDQGFSDIAFGGARNLGLPWTNEYAAMPSMHQGFAVLFGVTLYRLLAPWLGWPLAAALPVLMFFAVVATANHFVVDALAGTAVVVVAMLVARTVESGAHSDSTGSRDSIASPPGRRRSSPVFD